MPLTSKLVSVDLVIKFDIFRMITLTGSVETFSHYQTKHVSTPLSTLLLFRYSMGMQVIVANSQ